MSRAEVMSTTVTRWVVTTDTAELHQPHPSGIQQMEPETRDST